MRNFLILFSLFLTLGAYGQARNTAKTKDFPLPLNFNVVGHGVDLKPLVLEYDLESSNGERLMIDTIEVSTDTFYFDLIPANQLEPVLTKNIPKENLRDWIFLVKWPNHLLEFGNIEMISRTGRVIWNHEITSRSMDQWEEQLQAWREALLKAKVSKEELAKLSLFQIQFGIREAQDSGRTPFWTVNEPFRFCISQITEKGQTRLCTSQYQAVRRKKRVELIPVALTDAPARVILMNEPGKLADKYQVPLNRPVQFYAELKSGMSYEFTSLPKKINIMDMVQDKSGENAYLTIESDMAPLTESIHMNKVKPPEWVEWLGWQQTIGDFRKFWRTKIDLKNPSVLMPGVGGGAFKQELVVSKLPTEDMRPFLSLRTIKGTYVDGAPIRGRKPSSVNVSSRQNSVDIEPNKEDFTWYFGAKEKGEFNRSYLMVSNGQNTFPAYQEVYKGYSTEISSRLTGVLGAASGDASKAQLTFMGEIAINHWFESLLGWQNYWVSKQRWGVSAKAFQAFTDLEISSVKSKLSVYTADLKYRLNPGLWGRDETWGLIAGYQKVGFQGTTSDGLDRKFDGSMLGGGFFWARSMPQVFEPLMNWLSFFDYPKWVDMEFIVYPQSLNQNVLGRSSSKSGTPAWISNWSLNFHGQVMFTDYFFGEAGFGLKQYDFSSEDDRHRQFGTVPNISFIATYGTVGLGFKF